LWSCIIDTFWWYPCIHHLQMLGSIQGDKVMVLGIVSFSHMGFIPTYTSVSTCAFSFPPNARSCSAWLQNLTNVVEMKFLLWALILSKVEKLSPVVIPSDEYFSVGSGQQFKLLNIKQSFEYLMHNATTSNQLLMSHLLEVG